MSKFNFAPSTGAYDERERSTTSTVTAIFAEGDLILAAPSGFCFDPQLENHTSTGGFALLTKCATMGVFGRRGADGSVLTATIGLAATPAHTPSAAELRSAFISAHHSARILETLQDGDLPLIKLYLDQHSADGASGTHWRGAFVVGDHIVSVALYAPNGSRYLGVTGANLLRDFMNASRNATKFAKSQHTPSDAQATQAQTVAHMRPRARPVSG